jgi:hypothetical protein
LCACAASNELLKEAIVTVVVSTASCANLAIRPADLTLSNFTGAQPSMWIVWGATANLVRCTFANNQYALSVGAVNPRIASAQAKNTLVRLQQCTFEDNYAELPIQTIEGTEPYPEFSALLFSDSASVGVLQVSENGSKIEPVSTKPLSDAPIKRPGINGTSSWLQRARQVCFTYAPAPALYSIKEHRRTYCSSAESSVKLRLCLRAVSMHVGGCCAERRSITM